MELVLLGTLLVAAMATVDIPESQEEDTDETIDPVNSGEKPYGVHG